MPIAGAAAAGLMPAIAAKAKAREFEPPLTVAQQRHLVAARRLLPRALDAGAARLRHVQEEKVRRGGRRRDAPRTATAVRLAHVVGAEAQPGRHRVGGVA
eukprot:6287116-Prymnesium_polylepis.1